MVEKSTSPGDGYPGEGRKEKLMSYPFYTKTSKVSTCQKCGRGEIVDLAERSARVDVMGVFLCAGCFYVPLDVAAGGPLHWCACDALAGLVGELERRGLIRGDSRDVWLAVRRVYFSLAGADYLPEADRRVILGIEGAQ